MTDIVASFSAVTTKSVMDQHSTFKEGSEEKQTLCEEQMQRPKSRERERQIRRVYIV